MKNHLKQYREAVRKAIAENLARGLPVYQRNIAIYPDGRVVKLQKIAD